MPQTSPQKILITNISSLTSSVQATALFHPLRRCYPEATIGFWVKDHTASLFEDQSLMDIVHSSDPLWNSNGQHKIHWGKLNSVIKEIHHSRYDVVFHLEEGWLPKIVTFLARIPSRIGFQTFWNRLFLTGGIKKESSGFKSDEHIKTLVEEWVQQKVNAIESLPRIDFHQNDTAWGAVWRRQMGWETNKIIMIHPVLTPGLSLWPQPRWKDLIKQLMEESSDIRFVLPCSPRDMAKFKNQFAGLPKKKCWVGMVPLWKVKAMLSQTSLFVGGESGLDSIAAALEVPVLPINTSYHSVVQIKEKIVGMLK